MEFYTLISFFYKKKHLFFKYVNNERISQLRIIYLKKRRKKKQVCLLVLNSEDGINYIYIRNENFYLNYPPENQLMNCLVIEISWYTFFFNLDYEIKHFFSASLAYRE